jgi:drug/metabolite transporter (DMT)-like permease
VPVLAALAGVVILREDLTARLVLAAVLVLGGVATAQTLWKDRPAP